MTGSSQPAATVADGVSKPISLSNLRTLLNPAVLLSTFGGWYTSFIFLGLLVEGAVEHELFTVAASLLACPRPFGVLSVVAVGRAW